LVDAHSGTVDVESTAEGGARFRLALPTVPGRSADPPSRPSAGLGLPAAPATATILVAEDEDRIRELIASSLERQGYTVFTDCDERAALAVWTYQKQAIDLLFLDVRMPHMDGTEFLRRAREDRPEVPAIFSSGFIPEETEENQEIFDRVLSLPKPYRIPDLLASVEAGLALASGDSDQNTTMVDNPTRGWDSITATDPDHAAIPRGPGVTVDAATTIQGVDALAPISLRRSSIGPDDQ
jgi:CheY-like chemotaxis protein